MKHILLSCLPALALVLPLWAAPLQKEHVTSAAKWVLHLDVEGALQTDLGSWLGRELVEPRLAKAKRDLKKKHDVDFDWRKIQSITAYGTDFQSNPGESGVLLIRTSLDVPTMLDQVFENLGAGPLEKKKEEGFTLYTLNEEVHGSAGKTGAFVVSKSRAAVKSALTVLEGKGETLGSAKTFSGFPAAPEGFFFLGLAEGFSSASKLPPQAKVLKNSDGGQLVLGENAGQLFARLSLSTKDGEAAGQIQQVVQGLLALGAMSQPENKELQKLISATKVGTNGTMVNVSLDLPASNVIARVSLERKKREKAE